jgi:metallophosphoesterase (TIGR03767 family)
MAISRRNFLALAGAGVVAAAVDVGGLLSPLLDTPAWADVTATNGRGLFGGPTTLDSTVRQKPRQDISDWTDYVKLESGPGEPHFVRSDIVDAYAQPTRAIESFVQITDLQLVDDKSPARVEFTDRWADLGSTINKSTDSAYRPHEMLSTHIVESMVQAIRAVGLGPVTGLSLDFTIATGDMVDNVQLNETRWYIDLLDGGQPGQPKQIRPESGTAGSEESVSGNFGGFAHDRHYWAANGVEDAGRDFYRLTYNLPVVSGLLTAARRPFNATGLGMPWYAAMGNHDGEIQGNYPVHPTFVESVGGRLTDISGLATGNRKAWISQVTSGEVTFPEAAGVAQLNLFTQNLQYRTVTADNQRRILTKSEFAAEHWNTSGLPVGHGFIASLGSLTLYQTYYSRPALNSPIVYITLDTVCYDGGANGRIPQDQFNWLEDQLQANSSFYYDQLLRPVHKPSVKDKLIVLFGHHTIGSINNDNSDLNIVDRGASDFYFAEAVEQKLLRFPNVILYVCGHTHKNEMHVHRRGVVTQLGNNVPGTGGFWEVATASHIDWPVQSRVFELAMGKNTISIFTTMVDLAGPVDAQGDLSTPVSLASLARELAANDPTERPGGSNTPDNPDGESGRRGLREDRNTQLLVPAPFFIGTPDVWGSSLALAVNSSGNLEVLGTKSDDSIWWRHSTAPDTWGSWVGFPSTGALHVVAAETNKNGFVEVFGADTANFGGVWRSVQTASGWTGWALMGEVNARSITAARNADGRMEVFITTPGGDVWHIAQATPGGTWGSWSSGFGLLQFNRVLVQVAAVTNRDGRVEVFAVSDQGGLWRRTQIATGGWTDWASFGNLAGNGSLARFTKITAALNDDGRVELFAADSDRRVWRNSQQTAGSDTWGTWRLFDNGQTRMTQLAARTDSSKQINLFGVDHVGEVWQRHQVGANTDQWSGWTSMSAVGALRPDVPIVPGSSNTRERIMTPTLVGLPESVARTVITGSALVLGTVTHQANAAPAGTVYSQSPAQNTVVFEGDVMNIAVSNGGVLVPELHGLSASAAGSALSNAGLVGSRQSDIPTPDRTDNGKVVQVTPDTGTLVAPGSTVQYAVGVWDGSNR